MSEALKIPTNKAELLVFIHDQWSRFVQASDMLPDEIWLSPAVPGGWNIRDHVGYVVRWTQSEMPLLTSGTPIPETAGIPMELWSAGDGDAINEWFRQTLQQVSPAEIRAERDRLWPVLNETVSRFSDDDLIQPARVSGLEASERPLLTVMSENYGLHFDDHRAQIEVIGKAVAHR